MAMQRVRSETRNFIFALLEVIKPSTVVTLGGEQFIVPLRWKRWFYRDYEKATFGFINSYCAPGSTFIDVGAHFGIFTVAAIRRVGRSGRVVSFEPCSATRHVLEQTLQLNNCGGLPEIRAEAVSDSSSRASFYTSAVAGDPANSLIPDKRHNVRSEVQTLRIDDLQVDRIDAIKIDAEGAELRVLQGCRSVVQNHKPHILLSVHPSQLHRSGTSVAELWNLISELRLRAYTDQMPVEASWFAGQTDLFDVTLIPRE